MNDTKDRCEYFDKSGCMAPEQVSTDWCQYCVHVTGNEDFWKCFECGAAVPKGTKTCSHNLHG
jgi:hypothetical protein